MNNRRDRKQIRLLGNQIFTGNQAKGFLEAYEDVHKSGLFRYLFVDLSPKSEESYCLRTNIFPDEGETVVYKLK